jgi:hypothetical protein
MFKEQLCLFFLPNIFTEIIQDPHSWKWILIHKNKTMQAMICNSAAELSELKVINSLDMILIFHGNCMQWNILRQSAVSYSYNQYPTCMRMALFKSSGVDGTGDTYWIYIQRVHSQSLVYYPNVGHWDRTPLTTWLCPPFLQESALRCDIRIVFTPITWPLMMMTEYTKYQTQTPYIST